MDQSKFLTARLKVEREVDILKGTGHIIICKKMSLMNMSLQYAAPISLASLTHTGRTIHLASEYLVSGESMGPHHSGVLPCNL